MTENPGKILSRSFGFEFPADLFRFHEFLQELSRRGLSLAADPVNIGLANVFNAFREGAADEDPEAFETRYHKDPPEFITLLTGDTDGLHWGYYVDDPTFNSFPVAHYYQNDAFELTIAADLFEAVADHLKGLYRTTEEYLETDSASAPAYRQDLQRLDAVWEILEPYRTHEEAHRYVTAPTRDGMGIIVPTDQYRPLQEQDWFQEPLYLPTRDEVRSFRQAALEALRDGYPGTALKLGKDLWDYPAFFDFSCELLEQAYPALDRPLLKKRFDQIREFRKRVDSSRGPGRDAGF
jgi:Uncharacterised conserved protein (DUF2228)